MDLFLSRQRRYEQQLDAEVRFHLDQQIADYIAEGMKPEEARRRALVEFGGETQIREECRDVSRVNPFADLTADVRYALRMIRKRPAFASVAVVALALGIGANSAVFSVVNALLLRPLDFPELDRLVEIRDVMPKRPFVDRGVTPADFFDWQQRSKAFESMTAYTFGDFEFTGAGDPEGVFAVQVMTNFLQTLKARPALGRDFRAGENEPGHDRVVILSDALWRNRFGADPKVIGRTVQLNMKNYEVIGVMPPGFDFPVPGTALWTAMAITPADRADRKSHRYRTAARVRAGATVEQANVELAGHARQLATEYPDTNVERGTQLVLMRERQGHFSKPFLKLLQATAIFVLLIACANLANLQLAHGIARRREIAVRAALGAGRWRVMRLLLIESVVIAMLGGAASVGVAYAGVEMLKSTVSPDTTRYIMGWNQVALHPPVLWFTLLVAVACGLIFGLSSAVQASKLELTSALKDGAQQGGSRSRLRPVLVVGEVTLAVVAVMGASQMVRGFQAMFDVYQGYSPDRLLTLRLVLPEQRYPTNQKKAALFEQAMAEAKSLPNVEAATVSSNLPGALRFNYTGPLELEGRPPIAPGQAPLADMQIAGPGYFETLRIPVVAGRPITEQDGDDRLPVAVISKRLAERYWPGEDPVGKRFKVEGRAGGAWRTVVGVVGDVHQYWFEQEPRPTLYIPSRQGPWNNMYLVVRTAGDPMSVLPALRDRIRRLDPGLPLHDPKMMRAVMLETLSALKMTTGMMMVFGVIAMALAAVGVYGVMSYSVTQRKREFGIRIAVGARPGAVLRMVMRQGLVLAAVGCALGLAGGFAVSRAMAGIMFGLTANSLALLAGVPVLLALVSVAACWVPARAVMLVDPVKTLRQD